MPRCPHRHCERVTGFGQSIAAALIGGRVRCRVCRLELALARLLGEGRLAPRLSIEVLPFTNLSDDREQHSLVHGITEDLTTDLPRLCNMLVISRNTAFTYRTSWLTISRSAVSWASVNTAWKERPALGQRGPRQRPIDPCRQPTRIPGRAVRPRHRRPVRR